MIFIIILQLLILVNFAKADDIHFADNHGPISVMGDHMHKKNEIMFSYRFSNMLMDEVLNGTKELNTNEIMSSPNGASNNSGTYMNSPVSMRMNMHMFGGMYAPSDYLTLMIMSGFVEKEMIQQRMAMAGGKRFQVNSNGISDTRISGLIKLLDQKTFKTHLGIGISLPTGSIDERDTTPNSLSARLGYGMQNGSGTFDTIFFLNNVNNFGKIKLGEQFLFKKSASGKNSKDYKYGNFYQSSIWASYSWLKFLSSSLKLNYSYQSKMEGSDNQMNPRMSPVMDSNNIGYQELNLGVGINFVNPNSFLKNHRIGVELLVPIFKRKRGIQMSQNFKTMFGWQYSF